MGANRDGLMTGGQRGLLAKQAIIGALMSALFVGLIWLTDRLYGHSSNSARPAVQGALLIPVVFFGWAALAAVVDAAVGRTSWLIGSLGGYRVPSRLGTRFFVRVGPLTRSTASDVYTTMPLGRRVRAYHAAGSGMILSLEPAENPPPTDVEFTHATTRCWWAFRATRAVALGGIAMAVVGGLWYATAHPALPIGVDGNLEYLRYATDRGANVYFRVDGGPQLSVRNDPAAWSPPLADPTAVNGHQGTLYTDGPGGEVIGVRVDGVVHGDSDYHEPDAEVQRMRTAGGLIGAVGLLIAAGSIALASVRGRRVQN